MVDVQEVDEWIGQADRIWHLNRAALLQGLSEEEVRGVSRLLQDQVFRRGDVIFDQHAHPAFLYFLNRGSVRISMVNGKEREKTLSILRGGDVFGLESMSEDVHSHIRAVAHDESWVSLLPHQQFLKMASQQPVLYFNLVQILLCHLEDMRTDIRALCFMDIQERLAQTLLRLARSHGQKVASQEKMTKLRLRLSHDYLAGLIGSNRPYLSNIMSSFKKKGWIAYGHNHLLVNVEALRNFVCSRRAVIDGD